MTTSPAPGGVEGPRARPAPPTSSQGLSRQPVKRDPSQLCLLSLALSESIGDTLKVT